MWKYVEYAKLQRGIYSFTNPNAPWDHINMDFMIDLLKTQRDLFLLLLVDFLK